MPYALPLHHHLRFSGSVADRERLRVPSATEKIDLSYGTPLCFALAYVVCHTVRLPYGTSYGSCRFVVSQLRATLINWCLPRT